MPKYLKLEMFPPSSTTIPALSTGAVTQEIKVANTMQGQKNIMLKLKIGYSKGGVAVMLYSYSPTCESTCSLFLLHAIFRRWMKLLKSHPSPLYFSGQGYLSCEEA